MAWRRLNSKPPTNMKNALTVLTATTGASVSLALLGAFAITQNEAPSEPLSLSQRLQVDPTPPDREGPLGGYAAIVEDVAPSVVSISTSKVVEQPNMENFFGDDPIMRRFFGVPRPGGPQAPRNAPKQQGLGSGVILTTDGYIVTNNHVVSDADEILVTLPEDPKKPRTAEIVGQDPRTDLAVLKIDADNLPTITAADSTALKVGDTVLAIGNPFGLSQTVTSGIISALGRSNVSIVDYENFIQTDASINPGNSGGALVDNKGRLVGINTAIISRTGSNVGIGFAIPINMVVNIADQLIGSGEIERGYLGVMLGELTPDMAEAFNVPGDRGVLVDQVLPDTPAERAGLENGDIITSVDGAEAADVRKTRLVVSNKRPNTEVTFGLLRDGKPKEIKVTIGLLPSEGLASLRPGSNRPSSSQNDPAAPQELIEGVTVENLTPEARSQLGFDMERSGVLVAKVAPGSAAAEKGLQRGDIITEVGRRDIGSVGEATDAIRDINGKVALVRVWREGIGRYVALPMS